MALALSQTLKTSRLTALKNALEAGSGGQIKIYAAPKPSSPAQATAATVLVTFTGLAGTVAASGTDNLTLQYAISGTPRTASSSAAGTAVWARLFDGNGLVIGDCDVGTTTGEVTLNNTSIQNPGSVVLNSITFTEGN